ncbi:MAG: 30S ribosomal protein S9 [Candidatus Niyogibacteria bacterium]|nr:30S ribosomal protein S9 [Candidatus Niyogibacteria bacterium]
MVKKEVKPRAVKKTAVKVKKIEVTESAVISKKKYIEGIGRRKTSTARVRIFEGGRGIGVNGKDYSVYFPTLEMQKIVEGALREMNMDGKFGVEVKISGGGIHSQAEALRHGMARALVMFNAEFRKRLKKAGYLKRDPRMKERRKFGLKKARKAPQWSKR